MPHERSFNQRAENEILFNFIAYGNLPIPYSKPGTHLQIEVAAQRYEATVEKEPLYDPENIKVKS